MIRRWLRGARKHAETLDTEIDSHLEALAEAHRRRGLSDEDARLAARREFGGVAQVKERYRDGQGWRWLDDLQHDVRIAARGLRRKPGFTAAAAVTLALGVGVNAAIFSVASDVLRLALPFDEPERLLTLHTRRDNGRSEDPALSPPNVMNLLEEGVASFEHVGGFMERQVTLTGAGDARKIEAARVSAGWFAVLATPPMLGRTFLAEENEPGRERVVVLAHSLWQERFDADANIVGRSVVLDGVSYIVVGVMPPTFVFPNGRDLWLPLTYGSENFSASSVEGRGNNAYVSVISRLRATATRERGDAELAVFAQRLEERFPETNTGVRFITTTLRQELLGDLRRPLLLVTAAALLLLIVGIANVTGLQLARVVDRAEEMGLRSALGASRGRVVKQLLTESLLIGTGGGILGVVVAFVTKALVLDYYAEPLRGLGVAGSLRLDGATVAVAIGIAILATVIAGLVPALRVTRRQRYESRHAGRTGSGPGEHRLRSALVVGQLAVAVFLLQAAGLFIHSFVRLAAVDPGFRSEHVLSVAVDLPRSRYASDDRVRRFFDDLSARMEQPPGMLSVGAISRLPIASPGRLLSRFEVESQPVPAGNGRAIGVRVVTPAYFETMGIAVVKGRGIVEQDQIGREFVVTINETAARQFFGEANPIGHRLINFGYDPIEEAADAFTIVGVVADVRTRGLSVEPFPEAYFPHSQVPLSEMVVVARMADAPITQAGLVRTIVRSVDPDLPVEVTTLARVVSDSLRGPRLFGAFLGLASAAALLLAGIGTFALLAFVVAGRRREIGVRVALGASTASIVAAIVRHAALLVTIALGGGFVGAMAFTRFIEAELFGVTSADPVTLASTALLLGVTGVLASAVPAYRAATIQPQVVLSAT